jgi:hypothetical protein
MAGGPLLASCFAMAELICHSDGYNSALAAGALMSVSFGTSCVLDWRDLRSLSDDLLPV